MVAKVSILFLLMISQALPAFTAEEVGQNEVGQKVLCGHVEYKAGQRVAEFETALLNLTLPCEIKGSLARLVRVAESSGRQLVWKRMLRQELMFIKRRDRLSIEATAAEFGMPLKDEPAKRTRFFAGSSAGNL